MPANHISLIVTLKPFSHTKAYCVNFSKNLCILSSYAIQFVLDVDDTSLLIWPWIPSDPSVYWQIQCFIWHRNCLAGLGRWWFYALCRYYSRL